MALSFKLTGKVLEVREDLHSFHKTTTSFWYYDIELWLSSLHGKKGDTPEKPMNEADIAWVKKYYLPMVGIQNSTIATNKGKTS